MTDPIPAERLSAAVPVALAIIAAIDEAPRDAKRSLDQTLTAALAKGQDTEALVLTLGNMAHALVATLSRQTNTPVASLLQSLGQVGAAMRDQPGPPGAAGGRR